MHVSARVDYALRAVAELAQAGGRSVKAEQIATAQSIPLRFLENILLELKHDGLVSTQRGAAGGYALARPASEISIADVIRAIDGPLANIKGERPEAVSYVGPARSLQDVWIAVRANLRAVLEHVTFEDLIHDRLPEEVRALTQDADAWVRR
jgi:Rrf2 family protein